MPRQPRIEIPNTVFHIFTRGHNKSALFLDDEDRYVFLKHLRRAQDRCPWDCLGYSLMTNHYHLQVKTQEGPLGKTMHYLNTLYAGHFNYRYQKLGHVFQNRFHSIPVQTGRYLLALSRYIHLNSAQAGVVTRPEDDRWSSYREYLGITTSGLLRPDLVLDSLSEDPTTQRLRYREFVEEKLNRKPEFCETLIWKTRIFGDCHFARWVVAQSPASFPIPQSVQDERHSI